MHKSPRINKSFLEAKEKLVLAFTSADFSLGLRRQKHGMEENKLKFKRSEWKLISGNSQSELCFE